MRVPLRLLLSDSRQSRNAAPTLHLFTRPSSAIRDPIGKKAREFHGFAPAVQATLMRRRHGSRRSCLPRTSANRRRCLSRSPQAQARIIGRGAIVRCVVHVLVGSTTVNSLRYSCLRVQMRDFCCAVLSFSPVTLFIQPFLLIPSTDYHPRLPSPSSITCRHPSPIHALNSSPF